MRPQGEGLEKHTGHEQETFTRPRVDRLRVASCPLLTDHELRGQLRRCCGRARGLSSQAVRWPSSSRGQSSLSGLSLSMVTCSSQRSLISCGRWEESGRCPCINWPHVALRFRFADLARRHMPLFFLPVGRAGGRRRRQGCSPFARFSVPRVAQQLEPVFRQNHWTMAINCPH